MTTEIIKGIIAVIIIAAAVFSFFIGDGTSQAFLIPLATFAFGYYFKQSIELPIAKKIAAARSK